MVLTAHLNLILRLRIDLCVWYPLCLCGMDRDIFTVLNSSIHNLSCSSNVTGTVNMQAGSCGQSMWHAWERWKMWKTLSCNWGNNVNNVSWSGWVGGSWQDLFCWGYEPLGGSYIHGNEPLEGSYIHGIEYLLFS